MIGSASPIDALDPSPRFSVVIPSHLRCESVRRLLSALARQTMEPSRYEVVVSIDGSEDGTREMVKRFEAPYALRAIWRPKSGRAAACNAGIRLALGELLVLLDDDMEPCPDFLNAHGQAHVDGAPRGVMGAVPISVFPSSPPVVHYMSSKFNRHLENLARPGHRFQLRDFYTGNFSIRRDVLVRLGGFNEAFTIYGNEDLELYLRLVRAGVELAYSREALARQHYTKDFGGLARDTMAKGRTAVLLASLHRETLADLQLAAYRQAGPRWRLVRGTLLLLSRLWPPLPERVIGLIGWIERRGSRRLDAWYRTALDYFYWVGAVAALRENQRAGRGLTSLGA